MSLAKELKERQDALGMNEVEFAALIGIGQATLNRLYHGKQRLGVAAARKIKARFPGLDVAQFLFAGVIPAEQESDPSAA